MRVSLRLTRLLRWFLFGTFLLGMLLGVLFGNWGRNEVGFLPFAVYTVIGALLAERQPRNAIGWLFLAIGAVAGLSSINGVLMAYAVTHDPGAWYGVLSGVVNETLWVLMITLAINYTLLLFPDGLLSPRWKVVLWASVGATAGLLLLAPMTPNLNVGNTGHVTTVDNPLYPGFGAAAGGVVALILGLIVAVCGLLAIISAVLRFRRSRGVQRLQMRWLAWSSVAFAAYCVASVRLDTDSILGNVLFAATASLIPLSCGLAILRYHLYDIDRIISRTASYAVVTTLLIGTYLLLVWLMSELFGVLVAGTGGSRHPSSVIVAAATLTAAALARPLLRRVQAVIDRRFDRTRYDGQRAVAEFGSRLRHEVDVAVVSQDLVASVKHTLAPEQVSLWIR